MTHRIPDSSRTAVGPATRHRLKVAVVGGADIRLRLELVQELARDFEVCVLGPDYSARELFDRGGAAYYFYPMTRGMSPWRDLMSVATLVRLLRAIRPDIVHAYDSKPCALGRIAAWIARVPVIIGTHPGMGSLYASNTPRIILTRFAYERTQKLACRVSDLTILQNAEDLEDFVSRRIMTRSSTMVVHGSGVDTKRLMPSRPSEEDASRLRTSLGVDPGSLVVTMVSRIMRTKGVLDYARAARQVGQELGNVQFLLIGGDDQESPDRLRLGELEFLRDSVRCLGRRNDVAGVLSITDIFVLPSFSMEGVPRALLEAAACGLPIVTTNTRGCRDVVRDGISGILVAPRDADALAKAILSLLHDPGRRVSFGSEARKRAVEEFDLDRIASRLTNLYLSLAARVSPQTDAIGRLS